jgi:N-acetylmuramoyl-L-alanine amidase
MALQIQNDRLASAQFVAATKNTEPFLQGAMDTIIIHYTAGSSAASSITSLTDPAVKASAHVVVGRDGVITQLVPFNIIAWHAGPSQYGNRKGFNQYSIGIEIDNAGLLEKRGNKYYSWFGKEYPENEVVFATHRNQQTPSYWHAYTEPQLAAVEELCRVLVNTYPIKYILGHEEISPGRKVDPGPAFPLNKLRQRIFGSGRDEISAESASEGKAIVQVDQLNIRSGASISAERVALPLPKGQRVRILEAREGWYRVSTEITGWVSAKFIAPE